MAKKISPDLEREILAHAGRGMTTRAIAEWCRTARDVKIHHGSIADLLAKTRETRSDVAAAVTREALRPHVTSDLDRLEEIRVEAAQRRADDKQCSHLDWVRLAQLEVDILDRKLKLAGAQAESDGVRGGVVLLPALDDG